MIKGVWTSLTPAKGSDTAFHNQGVLSSFDKLVCSLHAVPLPSAFDLSGRSAIVTGASGHLGTSMARTLATLGARLLLLDIDEQVGSEVVRELSGDGHVAEFVAVDLACSQSIAEAVDRIRSVLSTVDVLVNNAAMVGSSTDSGYLAPFAEQTDEAFLKALSINLVAPFVLTRSLLPLLEASGHASIVNIASIYGLVGPVSSLYDGTDMHQAAAYSASKGGLIQLTRYLATTLAPRVRVNAVAPGGVYRGQDAHFLERYTERTPMGRLATESDLDGVVSWLASDASAYVTGQVVAVDGGWTAW